MSKFVIFNGIKDTPYGKEWIDKGVFKHKYVLNIPHLHSMVYTNINTVH